MGILSRWLLAPLTSLGRRLGFWPSVWLGLAVWLLMLLGLALLMAALLSGRQGVTPALAAAFETSDSTSLAPMRWQLQGTDGAPSLTAHEVSQGLAQDVPSAQSAEAALQQVFETLEQGQRQRALEQAGRLVQAVPNFQLAQLLHAELLQEELPPEQQALQASLPDAASTQTTQAMLESLRTEARRRLQQPPVQALQGMLPRGVLQLGASQRYLAAVDASTSRLYWFVHERQGDEPGRLRLLLSTYISLGANGIGKSREGDARTPLGVYFVQRKLPGQRLPDLYGAGALTLNYPNAIDRMRERTGSGIWFHGTPRAQYARAPLATDGCVVLANPDMQTLLDLPGTADTPVLIAERLQWVPADSAQTPPDFAQTLQDWLQQRHSGDPQALAAFYSPRFERDDLGLDHWWPALARQYAQARNVQKLQLESAMAWHDQEDLIVATLSSARRPSRPGASRAEQVRTYWRHEAGRWKIVYEGPA